MHELTMFPPGVSEKLGNYVYRLIDPRYGATFYVGKGQGNRVFDHARGVLDLDRLNKRAVREEQEDNFSLKLNLIREIKNARLEVQYVIHRHGLSNQAAHEVEAALIDAYPGLSNIQGGHGSGSRGPMHVQEIIDKYALPSIAEPPIERLVLINVNYLERRDDREAIYEQVRFAWRISKSNAEKADYVLAVVRGVVVGVFEVDKWMRATAQNFPNRATATTEMPTRNGFVGRQAPDDVWERFVGIRGKRIEVDGMRHIQNPIRYWNI